MKSLGRVFFIIVKLKDMHMDGLYLFYLREVDSKEGTCLLDNYPLHCSALFSKLF